MLDSKLSEEEKPCVEDKAVSVNISERREFCSCYLCICVDKLISIAVNDLSLKLNFWPTFTLKKV